MCGIFGAFKTSNERRLNPKIIMAGAIKAQASGLDSAGICFHKRGKAPILIKQPDSMGRLILEHYDRIYNLIGSCDVVLAHTRFATTGAVTYFNAQPFMREPYVFLHNGHISGLGNKNISDSNELSFILQRNGVDALKEHINTRWGFANLVIYDYKKNTLLLSPEQVGSRIIIQATRGVNYFASVPNWLPFNKSTKLVDTFSYKVGTQDVQKLANYRDTVKAWRRYITTTATKTKGSVKWQNIK